MSEKQTEMAVIGGGPGGYAAAFMAADLGLSVTLIDPAQNPGGVCLYRGCIPSKALLHAAKIVNDIKSAEDFGINVEGFSVDTEKLRGWKEDVVAKMTTGLGQLAKQKKIIHIKGKASFVDDHALAVTLSNGETERLGFSHAVIATGSGSVRPSDVAIDSEHLWDATDALALPTIPKRLLIVGGGYIGLELGFVYASFGSKVNIAEMTCNLLPGVDKDLVRFLKKRLTEQFESIHLETTASDLKARENGIEVTLHRNGENGDAETQFFDKVLVAVGRRPNTGELGLEKTDVRLNEKGFVVVDEQRRTNVSHIFAIGDVAGEPMLAHKATHEGRTVASVIAQQNVVFDPVGIPAVVFTDPEIAWVGLTEAAAKAKAVNVKVVRFPWAASGRCATLGRSDGLTKLIVDSDSERLLGIGMVGPGAGELIAEGVLALEMGANVTDIGLTIHPHPTLSETIMEAADVYHGMATHYHSPRRKTEA